MLRLRKHFLEICLFCLLVVAGLLFAMMADRAVPSANPAARLVLLYVPCTVNVDYLQPYNASVRYTPNLAAFASKSLIFLRHQTQQTFSGGAYASLFTGTYPDRHLVYFHPSRLTPESYTIAEAFRDNGYETFTWSLHSLASPELNYAQGVRPENIYKAWLKDINRSAKSDKRFLEILTRLARDPNYKVFIQVNFSVTHAPYTNFSGIDRTRTFCKLYPNECSGISEQDLFRYSRVYAHKHIDLTFHWSKTIEDLKSQGINIEKLIRVVEIIYKSCIHRLDAQFGKTLSLIQNMGLMNESLIVFTSDHGEVLDSKHSTVHWWHAFLEPEILNVPFIVHLPAHRRQGQRYENITRSIDIFPTLAGLCKIRLPDHLVIDGYNLSNIILERESPPKLLAFSNNELSNPAAGIDDPRHLSVALRKEDTYYRLSSIHAGSKLFILDPKEDAWKELIEMTPSEREINDKLRNFRNRLVNPYKHQDPGPDSEHIREMLRSLGYIQ